MGDDSEAAAFREVALIRAAVAKSGVREERCRVTRSALRDEQGRESLVTMEGAMRWQKLLESLREKDGELEEARGLLEASEGEKSGLMSRLRVAEEAGRESRSKLAAAEKKAMQEATRAKDLQVEVSRLKGLLAKADFDLDFAEKKYENLLNKTALDSVAKDLKQRALFCTEERRLSLSESLSPKLIRPQPSKGRQ